MRRYMSVKRLGAGSSGSYPVCRLHLSSEAAASYKTEVPVTLHLDVKLQKDHDL